MQKGTISVQTENIFPIIKQFLYSDREVFLRELIANATDATTKLKTLSGRGEVAAKLGDLSIEIIIDAENKTLTIRDKGIGMTEEEVQKYLNQVAFSSAQEFLEQYKTDGANIIGHFGLGFYSAFMAASKVEVVTKSWKDAPAVRWTCDGSPEYTIEPADKTERGTDIILHVTDDDNAEFLESGRISELLNKYCKFLPIEIRFEDKVINNTHPAWKKQPAELTDEDYKAFYQELYPYSTEPLFWIHLNIDYPFNLTGILYFPQLKNQLEVQKNKIHLYSNQVYVTDEVKEIVPEFLQLLHGVINSPDIPLNVSRSYLQSDRNVKKITAYITRKVADKLEELFKTQRESYQDKWGNIGAFVKYGMLTDEKFAERGLKFALLQNLDKAFFTHEEYLEKVRPTQTNKDGKTVLLYTNSPEEHDAYIKSAQAKGYDVLLTDTVIDNHFMQHLEGKLENVSFARIDADTIDRLIEKEDAAISLSESEEKTVQDVFAALMPTGASVELRPLTPNDAPVQITKPEFMRRMKEMQMMSGMGMGDFGDFYNVVVNTNHPLISDKFLKADAEKQQDLANYLYGLARINQNMLKGADLTAFVQKSLSLLA